MRNIALFPRSIVLCLLVAALVSACTMNRITTISLKGANLSQGGSSSGSTSGTGNNHVPNSGASVTLAWAAGAVNPQGYVIEQSTDQVTFTQAASVGGSATTATISGLAAGQTYYFRIHAFNPTGNSPPAPVISASIPAK